MDIGTLWAGLAIWIAWLWVSIWEWIVAMKAITVIWKNPDLKGTILVYTILWIALVESAAIYGLIVAFKIKGMDIAWLEWYAPIAAWLAIWAAGCGAWVWEWLLVWSAMESILRNPEIKWQILTYMILFLALVESAAIYGLIIAFSLLA